MSETPLLQTAELTFAYRRGAPVIDGVEVRARRGTVHMLIGPNGSGKTTLLRLMLGRLRPGSGDVRLGEHPVGRIPARRRAASMAYVPQRSATPFAFTARQVVAMGRFALPPSRDAVEEAVERCKLRELADRPYPQLSVGQQQRVLLARAMCQITPARDAPAQGQADHGPGRVLLADEPTSAMDLAHVHRTMRQLRELAGRGVAVVAVVQDLNLAARYADRVWLMDRGRLAAEGPWREVLDPPLLEPVYGVKLERIERDGADAGQRPLFDVRDPAGVA